MIRVIFRIDGMRCGMCEAHVNDAIRRSGDVKKVKSSHRKGTAEFLAADEAAVQTARTAIEAQGYRVLDVSCEEK